MCWSPLIWVHTFGRTFGCTHLGAHLEDNLSYIWAPVPGLGMWSCDKWTAGLSKLIGLAGLAGRCQPASQPASQPTSQPASQPTSRPASQQHMRKQTRKQIATPSLSAQNTFKKGSQDRPNIDENFVPDPLESILLLPWSPRVLPTVSKWSSRIPKCRHQAPEWQPRKAKRGRRQRAYPLIHVFYI